MASMSNLMETNLLKLIFQNIDLANLGDVTGLQGSATDGSLYLALYTSDPTETDIGTEANYTGYVRKAVVRNVSEWTVTSGQAYNTNDQPFAISTGITNIITHVGIRTASTGGDLLFHIPLTSSITIESGDTPKFSASALTFTAN